VTGRSEAAACMLRFMHEVACLQLWQKLEGLAKKARCRRAAVAYVTNDLKVKFGKGDLLVVDASDNAIRSGQTSASVLRSAHGRHATIFNLPGLHAKLLLFDRIAVIGSANLSNYSVTHLIEAGLITDDLPTVFAVNSLIEQLADQAQKVDKPFLDRIAVRQG
jgi:phosphatidylserine/phosphatidylglycerophosphate/cardiolipin synthase-like enzyme